MAAPTKKFRAGAVTATIWENQTEKGKYYSVETQRSYKDKDNKWQNTNSLRLNDLPKATLALNKAYEWILTEAKEEKED